MIYKNTDFSINKYIKLRLEDGKTNIYVCGELFEQCKYILLHYSKTKKNSLDKINSIDETTLKLNHFLDLNKNKINPQLEFIGHCSNLQTWEENNYDTCLIHSNLGFPLLKKLVEVGDVKARRAFKEEIIKRYINGSETVQEYLIKEKYLDLISDEEKFSLMEYSSEQCIIKNLEKKIDNKLHLDTIYNHFGRSYILEKGKVTGLNLTSCELKRIPSLIVGLKFLKKLKLNYNSIKKIPKWINNLESLEKLFFIFFTFILLVVLIFCHESIINI